MHQSGKEKAAVQPEQQLLFCSVEESLGMIAAALCDNELSAGYSSVSEQLKRQHRKTFR
ncbi:hypothetical protein N0M98_21065 [Paenibacillus doosanensis]|uniref:Uncharacterized protein n=1 Tax=Paenibacillus konkukensis TaxID=2020716 RepID=A0ABY4RLL5_9BACL|nr:MULTISPECIES: hypothetical protein [Paenibacillus]MCS7462616.1 hypothetical protein [Paenibacillus doosanensis]UQZ82564.1 hypothetical protein SK3146_01721 [Paenibacillus konkukensis]